jgi:hypothetical protein
MARRSAPLFEVTWIIGIPQSGKTTLAVARAVQRARVRRFPLLVIDPAGVAQARGFPVVRTVAEVTSALFRERRTVRFRPSSLEELERVIRAIRAGKRAVVLLDEAHTYLSARDGSSGELLGLMRETQHAKVDLFCTTQHLTGDVPQAAISCTSRVLAFRCTAKVVLDRLEKEWGADPAAVRSLPQFHYLEIPIGFQA